MRDKKVEGVGFDLDSIAKFQTEKAWLDFAGTRFFQNRSKADRDTMLKALYAEAVPQVAPPSEGDKTKKS